MKINIKKPGEKGNPSKRCYYYEFALRGERYRGVIPDARNAVQAKQAAEAIWDDLFNKRFNPEPPAEAAPLLFASFVKDTYLPLQQTNKKRSYARDAQIAGVLCEFFAGKTLQEIKKSDVEEFKRHQSEAKTKYDRTRSPATVNRELSVLSAILTLAVDDELLPSNPCRRVKPLRTDNERSRYLSKDEEKRLFAALAGERLLQDIVTLATHTGLRRGELFNLRWFDVDLTRGVIHVRNTKTARDRVVPMNAAARSMLERLPKTSGYVFPSPKTGERLVDIKKKFNEACETAKIENFRFHDLRHTAATRMADAGVNVIVIAEILGHSDIRMTKRYSHAMAEAKREAVEKLAKPAASRQKSAKSKGKEKRQGARPAVNS